jgi:hypothetical protein
MSTEFITDVVDTMELTGYVRDQADGDLPFGGIFPSQTVDDIEYELTQVEAFDGVVAKYRSWDTAPPIEKRPGVAIIGGEIPPLGVSFRLNERDVLSLNKVRAKIAEKSDAKVSDRIFNDGANAGHGVQNRITLAHGELLTSGIVTLTELGSPVTGNAIKANFGVPGGHIVTAGTLWSDLTNAVPLTNLLAWETTYRDANGGLNPEQWMMSSTVAANLCFNAQVRNIAQGNGVTPSLVNLDTVRQVLKIAGVQGEILVADVKRPALDGSGTARVIAERKIVALRQGQGYTLYGTTPNAINLAGNGTIDFSDAPGIIAFVETQVRPAWTMTTAEAVALPVVRDPKSIFCATV